MGYSIYIGALIAFMLIFTTLKNQHFMCHLNCSNQKLTLLTPKVAGLLSNTSITHSVNDSLSDKICDSFIYDFSEKSVYNTLHV